MANLFLIPEWFFGYDVLLEFLFAIITLIVGIYAFKVYRLSGQNQPKLFGLAFFSFSISYFIQSFLNYVILLEAAQTICNSLNIGSVSSLNLIGMSIHALFFIVGLITLAYMTLKSKSNKTYILLMAMSLLSFFTVANKIYWFYAFSSLLLIFISYHYLINFINNKERKTFLVFLAFAFLLFGQIHFIFSINHATYYMVGHFLELTAYILILINLILILKNGKKKR